MARDNTITRALIFCNINDGDDNAVSALDLLSGVEIFDFIPEDECSLFIVMDDTEMRWSIVNIRCQQLLKASNFFLSDER